MHPQLTPYLGLNYLHLKKLLTNITRVALYSIRNNHAQKPQLYCCSEPTAQKTSHMVPIVACRLTSAEISLPVHYVATVGARTL
jgi:hypothetical protein